MIERNARVVAATPLGVTVEAARESTCGDCAARGSCGTEVLGKVIGRRSVRLDLPPGIDVEVGDRVVIGLSEGDLARGAALVYLLPLLAMFGAALVAERVAPLLGIASESGVLLAATAGLAGGLVYARRRLRRPRCDRYAGARLLRHDRAEA